MTQLVKPTFGDTSCMQAQLALLKASWMLERWSRSARVHAVSPLGPNATNWVVRIPYSRAVPLLCWPEVGNGFFSPSLDKPSGWTSAGGLTLDPPDVRSLLFDMEAGFALSPRLHELVIAESIADPR